MEKRKAKYRFGVKNFSTGDLDYYQAEVEICGETEKSYRIRFLKDVWRYKMNSEIWVRKKNIILPREIDYSNAWWNK